MVTYCIKWVKTSWTYSRSKLLYYSLCSEEQLIVNAMDLFSAGSETTATTLAWAIAFMIIQPEV